MKLEEIAREIAVQQHASWNQVPEKVLTDSTNAALKILNKHLSFSCKARQQGTAGGNDPQDCDWPFCGCDPKADKVIEAIQESGYTLVKSGVSRDETALWKKLGEEPVPEKRSGLIAGRRDVRNLARPYLESIAAGVTFLLNLDPTEWAEVYKEIPTDLLRHLRKLFCLRH